jgi:hypothetical protein
MAGSANLVYQKILGTVESDKVGAIYRHDKVRIGRCRGDVHGRYGQRKEERGQSYLEMEDGNDRRDMQLSSGRLGNKAMRCGTLCVVDIAI